MNKNYFKVAIRNMLRHKGYAIINIAGLAAGAAACILIMLFVKSEWSYDKFNSKSDRLYRIWLEEIEAADKVFTETVTPLPLGPALQSTIPEIESTCRVFSLNVNLKATGDNSMAENATMVDRSFFNLFDFKLDEGNLRNPWPTANSILLTHSIAKKYFGNTSAMGQTVMLQLDKDYIPYNVSGVVNDAPEESSIKYDMLIPFDNAHLVFNENQLKAWHQIFTETYALMKNPVAPESFGDKFEAFSKQVIGQNYKPHTYNLHLQPITDIHLNNKLPGGIQPVSSPAYSYVLATIGILILLIACFNFITLSIARSTTRAMEVGVRKVLGAGRKQLALQFWTETFLFSLFSILAGIALAILFLTPFNTLFQKHLSITPTLSFAGFVLLLTCFIAVIAGSYPAVVLSGFNPTEVFKGKSKSGGKSRLRHALIGGQFIASITLITCTIVVGRQMNFMQHKDLGYGKERIIVVQTHTSDIEGDKLAELYKNELLKSPKVKSVSASLYSFAEPPWIGVGFTDEEKRFRKFRANIIDADFLKTMNIELAAGRNFFADKSDATTGILVNEAMVREFGWKNPVGQKFPGKFDATIIGVMKDFNFQSLHSKIQPVMFVESDVTLNRGLEDVTISAAPQPRISVLMQEGSLSENVEFLKKAWEKIEKVQGFDYSFLDETVAAQYEEELRITKIILLASGLSIFIACIGLFGLATLIVNRRVKEIGIRKVLGAQAANIVSMISKEFMIVVGIAAVVAFPVAWYAMNKWLQDFAYRVNISWWMFLLSGLIALAITLITVGFQALKAAMVNPANSLRTD